MAYDSRANAEQMAASIQLSEEQQPFVSSVTVGDRNIHRVRVGMYAGKSEAVDAMMQICPELGVADCWLENL